MFGLEGPKCKDIPAHIPCRHAKLPSKHVKAKVAEASSPALSLYSLPFVLFLFW